LNRLIDLNDAGVELDASTKECLESHRPEYGGGVRGGYRGGELHPEDQGVAMRLIPPTCIAGITTNLHFGVFGLVPNVVYQVVLTAYTVMKFADSVEHVAVFTGDMERVGDGWEGELPGQPAGAYQIHASVMQFCPGLSHDEAILTTLTYSLTCQPP
jgi:hypothetical protein